MAFSDFIEGVGRTNALSSSVDRLSDMVLKMRQQGIEERQLGEENRRADLTLESNLATGRLQQQALSNQLADYAKTQERRGKKIDITATPLFQALPDDAKPAIMQMLTKDGIVDSAGIGSIGDIEDYSEFVAKTPDLFKSAMAPVVESKKKTWANLHQQVRDMEAEAAEGGKDLSKDKKYQALKVQEKSASDAYQISVGSYTEHINRLEEQEAQAKAAKAKAGSDGVPSIDEKRYQFYLGVGLSKEDALAIVTENKPMSARALSEKAYLAILNAGGSPADAEAERSRILAAGAKVKPGARGSAADVAAEEATKRALDEGIANERAIMKSPESTQDERVEAAKRLRLKTIQKQDMLKGKKSAPKAPAGMPDAGKNKGRVVLDTQTGKKYRSDGKKWQEE